MGKWGETGIIVLSIKEFLASATFGLKFIDSCYLFFPMYCAGATACVGCPSGTFTSSNGSTVCFACPLGSFSDKVSAKNCSSCWSESKSCKSISPQTCIQQCNSLQFRVNPSKIPGNYLCRYGHGSSLLSALEFECTIPDPIIKLKVSCDYESSLLCSKGQSSIEGSATQLFCHSQPSLSN